MTPTGYWCAVQTRIRIGRGCRGDVISLAIENGDQSSLPRLGQYSLESRHSFRSAGLKKSALRFHDRRQGRDDVDDPAAEFLIRPRHGAQTVGAVPLANFVGQRLPTWVQTHT